MRTATRDKYYNKHRYETLYNLHVNSQAADDFWERTPGKIAEPESIQEEYR